MAAGGSAVKCLDVHKNFSVPENSPVLNSISFDVRHGEFLLLTGANGAGKTTLLRILAGLVFPLRGVVEILGSVNIESQRLRLSFLPDRIQYPSRLTGRQVINHLSRMRGQPLGNVGQSLPEIITAMGLANDLDLPLSAYSAGMLKRFSIALAMAPGVELLILDEPGDDLDPEGQRILLESLRKMKESKVTILLSTHHPDTYSDLADSLLILDQGEIVFHERPESFGRDFSKTYQERLSQRRSLPEGREI